MGRKRLHGQLVGVRLLPESYIPHSHNMHQLSSGKIIGTIFIAIEGAVCSYLRRCIIACIDAPKDFCFLNSAGWPFDISIEDRILVTECLASNVVSIQKKNGKLSRIGIKVFNGGFLGFIYLKFSSEISDVRNLIISDLGDYFDSNESFEFIENNSWPVKKSQENSLSVWDLVVNNCITIVKISSSKRNVEIEEIKADNRLKLMKKSAVEITHVDGEVDSHSILISYVHQEASTYARDLKMELKKMGFNKIFLDVDDIPPGQDWQDVISSAVTNCSVFVALVTSRYGETRWTNREAKLADDREKSIIPISFLDKWPPDQLAIQFVTLQYIPWKTADEINGGNFSGYSDSVWNQKSVHRVANEIMKLCSRPEVSTPDSVSLLDKLDSAPKFIMNLSEKRKTRYNGTKKKDLIVISAHPKQKEFVEKITKILSSDGYSVWSSMDMCNCDENAFSPLEDTQPLIIHSPLMENIGTSASPSFNYERGMEHSSSNVKNLKKIFKEKVKEAKLVVLIFSDEYLKSRICWQQLFYCEQRKKAIVIKLGSIQIDSMILNLYPEHEMITEENWKSLKFKIKEKLKFDTEDSYRSNIMLSVSKLKNSVKTDQSVYVIGGTDKISTNAETFSMLLGTELAKVKNLNLVTEGFFGAGDLVGKNFCEEQEIRNKGHPPNVFHIIPTTDASDYSRKARQKQPGGTFEKIPYGQTFYYGISVSNRDDIVAAAFKLCILIEGGERSACLAEKFLWNDCTVIPVLYNNNAIKNKQCLKESITKVPHSVDVSDWQNLNDKNCSVEERALSVKKIVYTLLDLNN